MVSIIIPVFNAEFFLKKSVTSILNQTYDNLEILICDDSSTDNSLAELYKFKDQRIKIFKNKSNVGYLRTINRLFELAKGKFIAFQDADDISHPKRIEEQVRFLESRPSIALVGTNFCTIDVDGRQINQFNHQIADPSQIFDELLIGNVFQKPSILFRREIYEKIGGFREQFLHLKNISEDYDWLLRASEKFKLSNINYLEPLYSYRSVPGAMTKKYNDIEQGFGHQIAQFLAKQRRLLGTDSLESGNLVPIYQLIEELKRPYEEDVTLFYFQQAEALLYSGLYKEALMQALKAVRIEPFKYRNVKCFLSCTKHCCFKFL